MVVFVLDLLADVVRDEVMVAFHDFLQERRAHRVDEVRPENAAGQKIDAVVAARFVIAGGEMGVIEVGPERLRVDFVILYPLKRRLHRMDVVDGEQASDAQNAREGGDQAGHPVVAVDQVRIDLRDDRVDDLPLEGEAALQAFVRRAAVDAVACVEQSAGGEMDAFHMVGLAALDDVAQHLLVGLLLVRVVRLVHLAVVRDRHMDVRPQIVQRLHKRRRHIGHAAGFGAQMRRYVAHACRNIRDFRRHDQHFDFSFACLLFVGLFHKTSLLSSLPSCGRGLNCLSIN